MISKSLLNKVIKEVNYPKGYEKELEKVLRKIKLYPLWIPLFLQGIINKKSVGESKSSYFFRDLRNKLTNNQAIYNVKDGRITAILDDNNAMLLNKYHNKLNKICKECGDPTYSKICQKCTEI